MMQVLFDGWQTISLSESRELLSMELLLTILQCFWSVTGVSTRPPSVPYLCWLTGISLYLSGITNFYVCRRPTAISGYLHPKWLLHVCWEMMWVLLRIVLPAAVLASISHMHGYITEKNANNSSLPNTPERYSIGEGWAV